MDLLWISLAVFLASVAAILWHKRRAKDEVKAQFVVTGVLLLVFYAICFLSGICSILNFLFRWVL
jgi:hypothetical protein